MLTSTNRTMTYIDPSSAQTYNANNDVQFNQGDDFLSQFGNALKGPMLDIGSGDGKLTAHTGARFALPITGVDISSERVQFANTTYGKANIKFVVGNAATLLSCPEIASQKYGAIVSFTALHHVPKALQETVFQQSKQLLTEDGVIAFLIPGRSPELHDAISETAASNEWKSYFTDFDISKVRTYETPEFYKQICIKVGFKDCEVTAAVEKGGKKLDAEGMKNFIKGWSPHLAHLKTKNTDEKQQNQFLVNVVQRYFNKMKVSADALVEPEITQNRIVAYANKAMLFKANAAKAIDTPQPATNTLALKS